MTEEGESKSERTRKYTEKGLEWQLEQRTRSIRSLITKWNASAEKLSILLSNCHTESEPDSIRNVLDERDNLVSIMAKLREDGEQYTDLIRTDESYQNLESLKITQSLDKIESEHHDMIRAVTEVLRVMSDKKSETGSVTSRMSHRSSKSKVSSTSSKATSSNRTVKSRSSTRSSHSNPAVEAASLKIKLKYLEAESKAKLEFDRIKLQKGLDLAQVNLLDQFEEESLVSCVDKLDQTTPYDDYTARYVLTHTGASYLDSQDTKQEVGVASQVPASVTVQTQTPILHSPIVCTQSAVPIQGSIPNAPLKAEIPHTSSASMNPDATEFVPNTAVMGINESYHVQHSESPHSKVDLCPTSVMQNTSLSSPDCMKPNTHPLTQVQQAAKNAPTTCSTVHSTAQLFTSSVPCHAQSLASTQQSYHGPSQNTNQVVNEPSKSMNFNSEQALLSLVKSLTEQVNLGRLPAPEPSLFTGDPLKYPGWKVDFSMLIEQRKIPPAERIHYLKKYLGGTAKEAVENFFLISSDTAYDEAKKMLDERFGDPYVIGSAFRDKLEKWPKIAPKDCNSLQRFADFVKQCQTAMDSIGTLKCLNDDRENRKFLSKLPDWIVTRWSRTAYQWKEDKKEFPAFKVFADFLSKEAKIACNPVISLQSLKSEMSQLEARPKPTKPTGRSFLTTASGEQTAESAGAKVVPLQCLLCKGKGHDLDGCKDFLSKTLSERKAYTRENNLCFGCLRKGHISKKCRNRKRCKTCSKYHPTSLHGDTKVHEGQHTGSENNAADSATHNVSHVLQSSISFLSSSGACSKSSAIVPVYLSHKDRPDCERLIYAMLDTQSDTTFVLEGTCQALGLSGTPVSLALSTMHAHNKTIDSRRISNLTVRGVNSPDKIPLPVTFSIDAIPANKAHIPAPEVARSWPHLEPIANQLLPIANCEIGLLIGYNCARAMMPREVIPPNGEGPYAQRTDLGWSIIVVDPECVFDSSNDNHCVSHRVSTCEVPPVLLTDGKTSPDRVSFAFKSSTKVLCPTEVNRMFELDFSERSAVQAPMSVEDQRFLTLLKKGISFKEGHYIMPLPFRNEPPSLPDNKLMALCRLQSLRRKLINNETYRLHYEAFICNLIKNGHAEKVPEDETEVKNGQVWYIPHHGIYHPKKPGKLRVVFDCSAIHNGDSLNKHLLQGPDLTNTLVGVLCRFRTDAIAFTCDIEQMFHQFVVEEDHRNYFRFLWWTDGDLAKPAPYRMRVHLFGAASSPGCANFGLKQVASDNEAKYGAEVADLLRKHFYVDDGLKSVSSVESAVDMITKSQAMCKSGGLRLHKFASNSKEVLKCIPPEDLAKGLTDVDILHEPLPVERTLGVLWNIESDCFQFRIILNDKPLTRRGVLSTVSSVYDPLGFIAPVILLGKQILQQMCAESLGWDDPLPESIAMKWEFWRQNLFKLEEVQIRRCLKPDEFGQIKVVQFHHFSDASTTGYGQCSYLRLVDNSDKVHCSLVMAKSRVAPLKMTTIPRLELTAALVSVRVGSLLQNELEYADAIHVFWTDSRVVLGYISNESKRFHVFVSNRVQQIRESTSPHQWKYVETKSNPADIASRGASPKELMKSDWFSDPDFLWQPSMPTDDCDAKTYSVQPDDPEVKAAQCFMSRTNAESQKPFLERLDRFSSWTKAKKAVAIVLRFKTLLKQRLVKKPDTNAVSGLRLKAHMLNQNHRPLTVKELHEAGTAILQQVQSQSFSKELEILKAARSSSRNPSIGKASALYRLNPFIGENGLLQVGGRMRNLLAEPALAHPVILPRKCHITKLIIRHFHEQVEHQGRGLTMNEVRSNGFWILGCSSAVSEAIFHCVICRKLRSSTQDQKMADLPQDRVDSAPPFTYCGVDCFGPFLVREGRKEHKRYGVIFTCFSSRAIHLEIANSLDTDSFINALRRFLSLRGPIRQLRSDRGTNFMSAERELREAVSEMDDQQISDFLLKEGCDFFKFKPNVPSASHMGGVWERQIRTVRNVLTRLLQQLGNQLDDESLRTVICEVTAIVNSRPLSVENLNDPLSDPPLTPNHLLTMKSKVLLPPPGNFVKPDLYVRRRWRRVQFIANEFWSRWRKEYLSNLQSRSKWISQRRNMKVGDIVMIRDDNLPRNRWKLGQVTVAEADDDGLVRKVSLRTSSSSLDEKGKVVCSVSQLERPIHKLVLLKEASE